MRQADGFEERATWGQGRQGCVCDEDALLQVDPLKLNAAPGQSLETGIRELRHTCSQQFKSFLFDAEAVVKLDRVLVPGKSNTTMGYMAQWYLLNKIKWCEAVQDLG